MYNTCEDRLLCRLRNVCQHIRFLLSSCFTLKSRPSLMRLSFFIFLQTRLCAFLKLTFKNKTRFGCASCFSKNLWTKLRSQMLDHPVVGCSQTWTAISSAGLCLYMPTPSESASRSPQHKPRISTQFCINFDYLGFCLYYIVFRLIE